MDGRDMGYLNLLFIGLAGLTIGWILAFRALGAISPWGPVAGALFLSLVTAGVFKAARI
jgi:hypothetical protein